MNPYEQAISIIGETLSTYDEDDSIPCFGFGDDGRPCDGFEEVLSRYKEIVPDLILSGPTSFAPTIEMAVTIVEESGGLYYVLLIIADGQITSIVYTESTEKTMSREKFKKALEERSTALQRSQSTQYSHRCVSLAFNKTLKVITLSGSVVSSIQRTPFSQFLNLPVCKIHRAELNKLLNQKISGSNFILGKDVFEFTVDDVSKILNLRNEGLEIIERKKGPATNTIEQLFRNDSKIRRWSIEKILKSIREGEIVVDDTTMAQLWISLLFSTFLIPDSSGGFDPSILEYIADVDGIHRYNWAAYVYNVLMKSLETVKRYCLGCAWALMVWAYQKNPNLHPTNPEDGIIFRQWQRINPNVDNIISCDETLASSVKCTAPTKKASSVKGTTPTEKGSSSSGFSLERRRFEEELAKTMQENERLKCRVLQLEEENQSLREEISLKNASGSSSKCKEKEEELPSNQPSPAPAAKAPSSLVRRIKIGARKRNFVPEQDMEVYVRKREKNFPGKKAVTDSEYGRIDHFLSNIKYL